MLGGAQLQTLDQFDRVEGVQSAMLHCSECYLELKNRRLLQTELVVRTIFVRIPCLAFRLPRRHAPYLGLVGIGTRPCETRGLETTPAYVCDVMYEHRR